MEQFPLPPAAFSGEPRVVPPDAAFAWLRQGWATFAAAPGAWLGLTVLLVLVLAAVSIVPVIGSLAASLLTPLLTAGALHAVARVGDEGRCDVADLFAGFRRNSGELLMVGLIYMAGWLAIGVLTVLLAGGGAAGMMFGAGMGMGAAMGMGMGALLLAALLWLLLGTPLLMAVFYAPALVYFNAMAPAAAMRASFAACLRNWLVLTVLSLIVLVLCFFAALPLGLGFLVLIPILYGVLYASYRDIFLG